MSTNDQRFMDLFSLVIGVLVAIAVGLVVLALMIGSRTQVASVRDNPTYTAAIEERLRPIGRLSLTGEAATQEEVVATPAPVTAPLSGPQVFNQACNACHGAGIGGAPKLGDRAAWSSRIAQGAATLTKHALEGFQGKSGYMPPKGGWVNLSDTEIVAAVDYMVSESK